MFTSFKKTSTSTRTSSKSSKEESKLFEDAGKMFEEAGEMFKDAGQMFKDVGAEIRADVEEGIKVVEKSLKNNKIDPKKKSKITKQWEKNGRKYTLTIEE